MKAYLLDDEQSSIEVLEIYLNKYFSQIEVIGRSTKPTEAVREINALKPDLLFIDVQMPDLSGFEVLELISKPCPLVVFLTAFNQFAIEAIKFSALYYLIKPLNLQELKQSVFKAEEAFKSKEHVKNLEALLFNVKQIGNSNPRIAFNQNDSIEYVFLKDIVRFEADNNYTKVYLTNGKKLVISKTLKEFENLLENSNFIRVHQSHLINTDYMKRYIKTDGGAIELTDGAEVPVSRAKREILNRKFEIN